LMLSGGNILPFEEYVSPFDVDRQHGCSRGGQIVAAGTVYECPRPSPYSVHSVIPVVAEGSPKAATSTAALDRHCQFRRPWSRYSAFLASTRDALACWHVGATQLPAPSQVEYMQTLPS